MANQTEDLFGVEENDEVTAAMNIDGMTPNKSSKHSFVTDV